jgi:tetratricopeptide (TPR) repeat protein
MLNSRFSAGVRLAGLLSLFAFVNFPAAGQFSIDNPYDASIGLGSFCNFGCSTFGESRTLDFAPFPDFPRPKQTAPAATITADELRHPLSRKAARMLQQALHAAELGDHAAAIQQLRRTLAKYPSSAPYVNNFLGVEYVETGQIGAALASFEQVVRLMPHDAANHSNYGLALLLTGQIGHAEQEIRKALELDRDNAKAKKLLEILLTAKQARR